MKTDYEKGKLYEYMQMCEDLRWRASFKRNYFEPIHTPTKSWNTINLSEMTTLKTNKKSIMKNIKDTLKALTHSKEDKALIKAGLKNENNEWTDESRQFALEQIVDEQLAVGKFKEQMLKVAEERNKECN